MYVFFAAVPVMILAEPEAEMLIGVNVAATVWQGPKIWLLVPSFGVTLPIRFVPATIELPAVEFSVVRFWAMRWRRDSTEQPLVLSPAHAASVLAPCVTSQPSAPAPAEMEPD